MDFYQSRADPRDTSEDGQPCCDRCFRKLGFNPDSWIGYPVRHTTPFQSTRYSEGKISEPPRTLCPHQDIGRLNIPYLSCCASSSGMPQKQSGTQPE